MAPLFEFFFYEFEMVLLLLIDYKSFPIAPIDFNRLKSVVRIDINQKIDLKH